MKSRLLTSLESQITVSRGLLTLQLRAERAAYLARSGRIEEAFDEVACIRKDSANLSDSRLSAMLHFAEGLCHYYRDFGPNATDRLRRAQALAQIGNHSDVAGRAVSWLCLLAYSAHKYDDMRRHIDECVEELKCRDSTALARTSLTIAMAVHVGNRFDLAMPWYRRAHLFAVEMQDEAMISAMLHNMASLWLTNSRNAALGGPATVDRSRQALMGALSSFNFDDLVEFTALGVLKPLLEAQLCSLESNFRGALDLYDKAEEDFPVQVVHNWATWMGADRLWCRLNCGESAGAIDNLELIGGSLNDTDHADEQAATLVRLAECWRILGKPTRAQQCSEKADASWRRFSELQLNMLQAVSISVGAKKLAQEYPM